MSSHVITHQVQLLPMPGHVPHTAAVTSKHSLLTQEIITESSSASHLFPSEHVIDHHPALSTSSVYELLSSVGHGREVTSMIRALLQLSHHIVRINAFHRQLGIKVCGCISDWIKA